MKNFFAILFVLLIASCGNESEQLSKYDTDFLRAKESVRNYMKENLKTNEVIIEGTIGELIYFTPPIELINVKDSTIKYIHYEQQHFAPAHKDSMYLKWNWIFYKLDEDFNIINVTHQSEKKD